MGDPDPADLFHKISFQLQVSADFSNRLPFVHPLHDILDGSCQIILVGQNFCGFPIPAGQTDSFYGYLPIPKTEKGQGKVKAESLSSAASRIQIEPSFFSLFQIPVRMTEDYCLAVLKILRQIFFVMNHTELYAVQNKLQMRRKMSRQFSIVIPSYQI